VGQFLEGGKVVVEIAKCTNYRLSRLIVDAYFLFPHTFPDCVLNRKVCSWGILNKKKIKKIWSVRKERQRKRKEQKMRFGCGGFFHLWTFRVSSRFWNIIYCKYVHVVWSSISKFFYIKRKRMIIQNNKERTKNVNTTSLACQRDIVKQSLTKKSIKSNLQLIPAPQ
jgi:hypothetical protein